MPERNAERKIHIRMKEDLHRRLRIRCAELDTTLQDFVVELLDRELSEGASRRSAKSHAAPGRR